MTAARTFTARLVFAMAFLLVAYGVIVGLLGRYVAIEQEQESLQHLSRGLARHIVEHWPEIAVADPEAADLAARKALLSMLMVVNPAIQVYLLDADGKVRAYIGEPGMVRTHFVDLGVVRDFLAGAPLPLRGTDPMGSGAARIFSAAMFPPRDGDSRPPGYLYVVLDGRSPEQISSQLSRARVWQSAALAALGALAVVAIVGVFVFRRLTLPLRRLAERMCAYSVPTAATDLSKGDVVSGRSDEVRSIEAAFDGMTARIEEQSSRERRQSIAHREMFASVAHDLRTPLTAMHGHLEALAGDTLEQAGLRARVLGAALAQSDRVRRLSQQLFELAALQSSEEVVHRERFRLDELLTDVVQKFDPVNSISAVALEGGPPGRLEVDGDLHLIERALTNLIDNSIRHAPSREPVRVSVRREGTRAEILIEDSGPGLPEELQRRLHEGRSLRDQPPRRTSGGIGGLGLAIAQRITLLHGGSLRPLPSPHGGTRICMALPLAV